MSEGNTEVLAKSPMDEAVSKSVDPIIKEIARVNSRDFDEATKDILLKGVAAAAVKKASGYYLNEKVAIPVDDTRKGLMRYVDEGVAQGTDKIILDANVNTVLGPLLDNAPDAENYKDQAIRSKLANEINGYDQTTVSAQAAILPQEQPQPKKEGMDRTTLGKSIWNFFSRSEASGK